jgi:hypothetical protein
VSGDFWVGLLAIPILAAALLVLWLLFTLASNAWDALHRSMLLKTDLKSNTPVLRFRSDPAPEPRPKYEDAANHLRNALLRSPRLYTLKGLGWVLILARDAKNEPEMSS